MGPMGRFSFFVLNSQIDHMSPCLPSAVLNISALGPSIMLPVRPLTLFYLPALTKSQIFQGF